MKATHMTVFFTNGTTARFHDVDVLREATDEENLVFYYTSASDGKRNFAALIKRTVSIMAFAEVVNETA